ncbi:replication protein [bacterium]|nr:replication protein [bacterium]
MPGPQLEDGYTRIANEILEALIKANLSGSELRIALLVLRMTFGYRKKQTCIPLTEIEMYTGIIMRTVTRSVKSLKEKRVLNVHQHRSGKNMYSFNKNYKKWAVDNSMGTDKNVRSAMDKNVRSNMTKMSVVATDKNVSAHIILNKTVRKENFKENRIVPEGQKLLFENPKNSEDFSETVTEKNTAIEIISKIINKRERYITDESQSWKLVKILMQYNIAEEPFLWAYIVQSRKKKNPPGYLCKLLANPDWPISTKAYEQGKKEMNQIFNYRDKEEQDG